MENWLSTVGFDYEVLEGNALWRFGAILAVLIVTLAVGKLVQYMIGRHAHCRKERCGQDVVSLIMQSLEKPAAIAIFAVGLGICKSLLIFGVEADPALGIEASPGLDPVIGTYWIKIAKALGAIALAYSGYKLVDVIEYYLLQVTAKTRTKLDDMLVPVVRKSMRITIAIIAFLWIADGILEANIRAILLSAGVGGIAIALAAKDTVANFFGSITIFADRPFQIDELVRLDGHLGVVEDVGFRSTRVRTLDGSLVTLPNSTVANATIENLGRRASIRRTCNITITYDAGHKQAQEAVRIVKEILSEVPEVNGDAERPFRVYFSDFNDWSLNIYVTYWVKPVDWWLYMEVNERVNIEMMKRFEEAGIEFAFPTQTLYVKNDDNG